MAQQPSLREMAKAAKSIPALAEQPNPTQVHHRDLPQAPASQPARFESLSQLKDGYVTSRGTRSQFFRSMAVRRNDDSGGISISMAPEDPTSPSKKASRILPQARPSARVADLLASAKQSSPPRELMIFEATPLVARILAAVYGQQWWEDVSAARMLDVRIALEEVFPNDRDDGVAGRAAMSLMFGIPLTAEALSTCVAAQPRDWLCLARLCMFETNYIDQHFREDVAGKVAFEAVSQYCAQNGHLGAVVAEFIAAAHVGEFEACRVLDDQVSEDDFVDSAKDLVDMDEATLRMFWVEQIQFCEVAHARVIEAGVRYGRRLKRHAALVAKNKNLDRAGRTFLWDVKWAVIAASALAAVVCVGFFEFDFDAFICPTTGTHPFCLGSGFHELLGIVLGLVLGFRFAYSTDRYSKGAELVQGMAGSLRDAAASYASHVVVPFSVQATGTTRWEVANDVMKEGFRLMAVLTSLAFKDLSYGDFRGDYAKEREVRKAIKRTWAAPGCVPSREEDYAFDSIGPTSISPHSGLHRIRAIRGWIRRLLDDLCAAGWLELKFDGSYPVEHELETFDTQWQSARALAYSMTPTMHMTLLWQTLLWIFCLSLPFFLVASYSWYTIPITAVVSLSFFGLDRIAMAYDGPFGYDAVDINMEAVLLEINDELQEMVFHKLREDHLLFVNQGTEYGLYSSTLALSTRIAAKVAIAEAEQEAVAAPSASAAGVAGTGSGLTSPELRPMTPRRLQQTFFLRQRSQGLA